MTTTIYTAKDSHFLSSYCYRHLVLLSKSHHQNIVVLVQNAAEQKNLYETLRSELSDQVPLIFTEQQYLSDILTTPTAEQLFFGKHLLKQCIETQLIDTRLKLFQQQPLLLDHCFNFFLAMNKSRSKPQDLIHKSPEFRQSFYSELMELYKQFNQRLKQNHLYSLLNADNIKHTQNDSYLKKLTLYSIHPSSKHLVYLAQWANYLQECIIYDKNEKADRYLQLFSETTVIEEPDATAQQDNIELKCYETIEDEIKHTLLNMDSDNSLIILPESKDYKEQLLNSCANNKITALFASKAHQDASLIIKTFLTVLDSLKEAFSLTTLKRLSACEYIPFNSQVLEQYARDYQCKEKKAALQSLISELQERIAEKHARSNDAEQKKQIEQNRLILNHHLEQLYPIISVHEQCRSCKDAYKWQSMFHDYLSVLDLPEVIAESSNTDQDQYKQALSRLNACLSIIKQGPYPNISTSSIEQLKEYLKKARLTQSREEGQLIVYTLDDAHLIKGKKLFILGCNENAYKEKQRKNIFDSERFPNALKQQLTHDPSLKHSDIITALQKENHCHFSAIKQNGDALLSPISWASSFKIKSISSEPIEIQPLKLNAKASIQKLHNSFYPRIIDQFKKHGLSATALDIYQKCPYQFFLKYLCSFKETKDKDDLINNSDWGVILHNIMAKFNQKIIDKTIQVAEYKSCLTHIAKEELSSIDTNTAAWKAKASILFGKNNEEGLLAIIAKVYEEKKYYQQGISIERRLSKTTEPYGIPLHGTLDLLIQTEQGPSVIDYKSGKTISSSADIKELRNLQIPLYLSLSKEFTKETPVGAILFHIHSESRCEEKVLACSPEAKQEIFNCGKKRPFLFDEQFLHKSDAHINTLISMIANGLFSPEPLDELAHVHSKRKQECNYCDFKLSCRYKDRF